MKYTLPLITFLSLTVSSMALDDAAISQKIVGAWKMSAASSIVTFQPDGTFAQTNTINHYTSAGTWQVSGEVLTVKPDAGKIGKSQSLKIVSIDDHQFVGQHGTNIVTGLKQ